MVKFINKIMKYIYLFILILFISCVKNKEQKVEVPVKAPDTIEPLEAQKTNTIIQEANSFFKEINKAKLIEPPIFEDTNFDSFIEPEDFNDVNVKAFKILELYPNFYKDTHNFKAIALYRIKVSEVFYTAVITIKKGDNEMESQLINYDLKGNIIDSKVVAYDEIAEGMSKIESKIEHNSITINNILWIDEKKVETKQFEIKTNGKIELLDEGDKSVKKRSSYSEFKPQKVNNIQIDGFSINQAFQIGSFKVLSGNFEPVEVKTVAPDTEQDWGNRLLLLNGENEMVYKSQGVGDVYLYEPHFYKSDESNKVLIICQLAYEYPFGGDAFIFENGNIINIGTLDVEGYSEDQDEEAYIANIVEINEKSGVLEFTFKSDSLVVEPGSKDRIIKNNNVKYIYKNNRLVLKENNNQ